MHDGVDATRGLRVDTSMSLIGIEQTFRSQGRRRRPAAPEGFLARGGPARGVDPEQMYIISNNLDITCSPGGSVSASPTFWYAWEAPAGHFGFVVRDEFAVASYVIDSVADLLQLLGLSSFSHYASQFVSMTFRSPRAGSLKQANRRG